MIRVDEVNHQPRIAMLSVHSCPLGRPGAKDTGGMNIYIRELARELGRQGFLIDIYTRAHDVKDHQMVRLPPNVRLIHIKAGNNGLDKLALYSELPEFARNLDDFRERNGIHYDLIFSHYWLSGWVGQEVRHRWHVPQVVMFHTLGAVKNALPIGEIEPEIRLDTERDLAQSGCYIIATTEKEKEHLISRHGAPPERISVIPCGVNLARFRPIRKEKARQQLGFDNNKIVLFVGRIEPLKGIDQLLRALTYLNGQHPRLFIAGGDDYCRPEIERLQTLTNALGLRDKVTFLGLIKHEKLPYFYSAADVCVVPSYYESFGMVVLEAIACGTPVVAADVGGAKAVIRQAETGYVVADNAPHHLAEKIALLLAQPNHDTKSAFSIRATVAGFSWSSIARRIVTDVVDNLTVRNARVSR